MIGLEPTWNDHLDNLLAVFREVRRVLRDDGILAVNYGDAYAAGGRGPGSGKQTTNAGSDLPPFKAEGWAPKNLMMMPSRFAIAMQDDGWVLRSMIPWIKPNPMPESVTDRPTNAVEYFFLFSKNPKYFWDAVAVRTPIKSSPEKIRANFGMGFRGERLKAGTAYVNQAGPQDNSRLTDKQRGHSRRHAGFNDHWDAMSKEEQQAGGANMRNYIFEGTRPFKGAHFACVDTETEALTPSGWKRWDELRTDEAIAGYDMETGLCQWDTLHEVAAYPVVNQEMVRILGRGIDQLLTPNHRCVIERRSGRQVIVRADELKPSHKALVASRWEEGTKDFPVDLAALIGWYVTEGHAGQERITLYQSGDANPAYCDEIRALLNAEGAQYMEASRIRPWRGRDTIAVSWRVTGAVANMLLSLCPQKRLPNDFLQWPTAALRSLWDALMKGDGHFRDAGRQTFVQKDKVLIDQVQALACRLGYATTLRQRSTGTWALYKTESSTRLLKSETGHLISTERYTGTVWCPRTGTGAWVARRDGRVFITGNTFPPSVIEPFILAGTSAKGCCPECGAPWVREIERRDTGKRDGGGVPRRAPESADSKKNTLGVIQEVTATGWEPSCECDAGDPEPCVILDCFGGAGTTGLVADRHKRDAVLIEISAEYAEIARQRIVDDAGMLADVQVVKTGDDT